MLHTGCILHRKTKVYVTEENFIFGCPQQIQLHEKELELILRKKISTYYAYPHLYIANTARTITSSLASKAKKRVDYCAMYSSPSSAILCYGLVKKLLVTPSEKFAIVTPLHPSSDVDLCRNEIATTQFCEHFIPFLPPRY